MKLSTAMLIAFHEASAEEGRVSVTRFWSSVRFIWGLGAMRIRLQRMEKVLLKMELSSPAPRGTGGGE